MPPWDPLTPLNIFFALIGGILPALFWLWFWLREDTLHPEPRRVIMLAFAIGMLATVFSFPTERMVDQMIPCPFDPIPTPCITNIEFLLWAIIEEGLKWIGILIIFLRVPYVDEPIDAVIYAVTAALGFAALENALFLIKPLGEGDTIGALRVENFRFIGATLLHVAASALPGALVALTFFNRHRRMLWGTLGLIAAIVLHTLFNVSIMMGNGEHTEITFLALWGVVLALLYACEKIKRMAPGENTDFPRSALVILRQKS